MSDDYVTKMMESAVIYATGALKSLTWLSAGAAAALFAFYSKGKIPPAIVEAICVFFFSAIASSGTLALSYLTQLLYLNNRIRTGAAIHVLTVLVSLLAFGGALFGLWLGYGAVLACAP
jgi:hypothetical protein